MLWNRDLWDTRDKKLYAEIVRGVSWDMDVNANNKKNKISNYLKIAYAGPQEVRVSIQTQYRFIIKTKGRFETKLCKHFWEDK